MNIAKTGIATRNGCSIRGVTELMLGVAALRL